MKKENQNFDGPFVGVLCYVVGNVLIHDPHAPDEAEPSVQKQIFFGPASNVECGGWIVQCSEQHPDVQLFTVIPESHVGLMPWAVGSYPLIDSMDTFGVIKPQQGLEPDLESVGRFTVDDELAFSMQAIEIKELNVELAMYRDLWISTATALLKLLDRQKESPF